MGISAFNPIALRKAKIVYHFALSEYERVKNPWQKGVYSYYTKNSLI